MLRRTIRPHSTGGAHRSTGALDPYERRLQIGLGWALEHLLPAAPAGAVTA